MKKVLITSILIAIYLSLNFPIFAQSDPVEVEEKVSSGIRRYKWEVGADARAILNGGSSGASLFMRQQYLKKIKNQFNSRLMANRFRFGVNVNWKNYQFDSLNLAGSNNSPYYVPSNYYYDNQPNYIKLFFSIGKEQQEQFKKFQLFYGYDFILDFEAQENPYLFWYNQPSLPNWYISKIRGIGLGFAPLIGMKYFLHSRLAFSLEANWILKYSIQKEYLEQVFTGEKIKQQNYGKFSSQTNPMYAFNISFFFK